MINRQEAIENFAKIKVNSNSNGIIEAFGVLIQQLPADFWNLFSAEILKKAGDDLYEDASGLLENAAAECGYHTGYGIITSDEFNSIIAPMIEKIPEDILHGAFCVLTAWGWANSEIIELIPNEKMVIRAYDYYESDMKKHFTSHNGTAFMLKGISRAFMDLAYSKPYPNGLGKFKCIQTKGIELGDLYGEFIVFKEE